MSISISRSIHRNIQLGTTARVVLGKRRMASSSSAITGENELRRTYGRVPKLLYGTAWKKERTEELVYQALKAGFRGVDTAAQPRHYQEDLVAKGIRKAIDDCIITREDVFVRIEELIWIENKADEDFQIQTKFTPTSGQDPDNMPYDAKLPIPSQVHTSLESSLKNFKFSDDSSYIDCVLLHSELPTFQDTELAWNTLQTYVPHKIRSLGISNVSLPSLQKLLKSNSAIKPTVVQNRFYPSTKWETAMRKVCREHEIVFESFWTLTGNPQLLRSKVVAKVAKGLVTMTNNEEESVFLALYALVLSLDGITILNGTTNAARMSNDLKTLTLIERLKDKEWKDQWEAWVTEFKSLIGESA